MQSQQKQAPLPSGWIQLQTPDGKTYYQNDLTKTTQWERPSLPPDPPPASFVQSSPSPYLNTETQPLATIKTGEHTQNTSPPTKAPIDKDTKRKVINMIVALFVIVLVIVITVSVSLTNSNSKNAPSSWSSTNLTHDGSDGADAPDGADASDEDEETSKALYHGSYYSGGSSGLMIHKKTNVPTDEWFHFCCTSVGLYFDDSNNEVDVCLDDWFTKSTFAKYIETVDLDKLDENECVRIYYSSRYLSGYGRTQYDYEYLCYADDTMSGNDLEDKYSSSRPDWYAYSDPVTIYETNCPSNIDEI
eukprot:103792_1